MTTEAKTSAFSTTKTEVRDLIISVLSRDENLPAKSIYNLLKKEFRETATYQGVHKSLKQLKEQGILLETNKKYSINQKWISDLTAFVSKVEAKRSGNAKLDFGEIKNDTSTTMSFDSYMEALYALLDNMDHDRQVNKEKDMAIAHWYHPWPLLCVSKKEFEQLRRMMFTGTQYGLCNQTTPLDLVLAEFWRELNAKVQVGVPCATNCDILVTRDKVVQIFISPPVRRGIDEVFRSSSSGNINFSSLYTYAFGLKGNVRVIITQNAELADQIREETLKYFKEEKKP